MEFGHDGALYFATGGRNTQSGLYRVSYVGSPGETIDRKADARAAEMRSLRHKLEADPKRPSLILTVAGLGYKFAA